MVRSYILSTSSYWNTITFVFLTEYNKMDVKIMLWFSGNDANWEILCALPYNLNPHLSLQLNQEFRQAAQKSQMDELAVLGIVLCLTDSLKKCA